MTRPLAPAAVGLLTLLLACDGAASLDSGGGPGDGAGGDGGTGDGGAADGGAGDGGAAFVPDLPSGGCGLPEHAWLSTADMGEIVAVEPAPDISFDRDTIDVVLDGLGMGALTPVPYGVDGFRVRYVTQDKGQRVEVSGYLALPVLDADADVPLLIWEHPTTGFFDECAPTAQGIIGGAYAVLMAAHGFAVTAPDYLGMVGYGDPSGELHPWVVAEPAAIVSLDAARALLRFDAEQGASFGQRAHPDPSHTVIWGASEGGFAALQTDRYQAAYAPELTVTGVISVVPATDPVALAQIASTTWAATTPAIAAALVTMERWFLGSAPLSEVLNPPMDTEIPGAMESTCTEWDDVLQAIDSPEELYTADMLAAASSQDWSALQPWGCYLDAGVLRDSPVERGSQAPVLIVTGESDTLAWPGPVHDDIGALCAQGYDIAHVQCAGAEHTDAAVQSLSYQFDVAARLGAGEALQTDCAVSAPVDCAGL